MPTGIDHLVIAVPDLDAAADALQGRVGLACTGGGRHPGAGTVNRIAFLADGAYLELIAVEDRSAAETWPVGRATLAALDASGGGLATYALLDDRLDATVPELQANGSTIGPAQHGSRRRPDGEIVEWWTAAPERIGLDGVPFLIRHAYAGAEWGAQAMAARRSQRHPLGSPAILLRLDIATPDPPALAARYRRELGVEFWAVTDLAVCTLGRHTIRLVPRREMEVPAIVVLGAAVDAPRSTTLLGLRFDVEPAEVTAVLASS
jgi:catechol 2,3-dioxygenase-like lactoylglutathione lyase family enzyme